MTNPYGALVDEALQDRESSLRGSLFAAQRAPAPAETARALTLSQQTGLPPDLVQRNPQAVAEAAAPEPIDYPRLLREQPALADWLTDPHNAALSRDEFAALARVDRGAQILARPTPAPPTPPGASGPRPPGLPEALTGALIRTGINPLAAVVGAHATTAATAGYDDLAASAGQVAVAYGLASPEQAAAFVAAHNRSAADLRAMAPDYAQEFSQALAESGKGFDVAARRFAAGQDARRRGEILAALRDYGAGAQTIGGTIDRMLLAALTRPRGLAYTAVEGLASSAPALVLGVAGAKAGAVGGAGVGAGVGALFGGVGAGPGAAVGGAIGGTVGLAGGTFLGMAPVSVGAEINAQLQKRGVDVTDPDALRRAYADPALMAEVRAIAQRKGLTVSAASALVAPFGGKIAALGAEGNAAARVATKIADVGVQAAGQVGADVAGQAAGAKGDLSQVDLAQAMQTGIATLGFSVGETAIGLSRRGGHAADPVRAAEEVATRTQAALAAQRDAQALAEVGQAVREAPTTAQVPERLRALVTAASGGDDASTVYFQSAEWDAYWQGRDASPAQAAADLLGDGGRAYYEAKETGAPLAIPLGDYVARVAPTEHYDALLPIARTAPDGPSLQEAHEYLQALPATMADLAREAAAETPAKGAAEPGAPEPAQQISDRVRQQLEAAGRSPTEAQTGGQIVGALFRTIAETEGVDPLALFERYGLEIQQAGEAPALAEAAQASLDQSTQFDQATAPAFVGTEPINETEHVARYTLPSGDEAIVQYHLDGGELRIGFIGSTGGEGSVGPAVRAIARDLRDRTGATTVTGNRISGARPGREASHAAALFQEGAPLGDRVEGDQITTLLGLDQRPGEAPGGTGSPSGGARGRIRFGADGRVAIDLFKAANESTFFHETGHFLYRILEDVASSENATERIRADHAALRDWVGAESGQDLTRAQQERIARGFEAYLMEGKAPSLALRNAFYRLKQWLVKIYQHATALDAELTPAVRKVFDRLLASEAEIRAAEAAQEATPLFPDPRAAGMSEDAAARYQQAVAQAHQAAEEDVTARVMRDLRREESTAWKTLRQPIEAEVTAEVQQDPIYRALALLQKGTKPDGTPLDAGSLPLKLDREQIVRDYGADVLKGLPKGVAVTAFGSEHPFVLHPDVAAEMLGFRDGKQLLTALTHAPKMKDAIRAIAEMRMQEQHGERLSEEQLREQAMAAVRNSHRAEVLRLELQHLATQAPGAFKGLTRAITRPVPTVETVRAEAERIVAAKPVREIQPRAYEVAAAKAAREAREAFLRGDVAAAFEAKRRELLTTELTRAATAARSEMGDALERFRQVFRKDAALAKGRDVDLVNAARAVLAAFGLGRSDAPPASFLEQMRRYDPETYAGIAPLVEQATAAAPAVGGDWRALPWQDFRALRETVESLWTLSRRTKQMEIDGRKVDREAVVAELGTRFDQLPAQKPAGLERAVTDAERRGRHVLSLRSWLRRVEHWVDLMDGGDPAGSFRRTLWNPISEAATRYRLARGEAMARYLEIVKGIEATLTHEAIPAPELGYEFAGKAELLGALLHTGNESNLSKLLRGRHWGEVDEAGVLDRTRWDAFVRRLQQEGTLTKADYDYLQGVWDLFDDLKAGAQAAHHEMYGHYFSEITAEPFDTPFGRYRGGYAPAKADPFIAPDAQLRADQEAVEHADHSFMFPTTGRGFTKGRVEAYARPLIMDARFVPSHLDAVLRFTHLEPRVKDVGRLAVDRGFRARLDAYDPTAGPDMLVPWLQRTAQQQVEIAGKSRAMDRFWGTLRRRTGIQVLALNVLNAVQQITGLSISAVQVPPGKLAGALWRYIRAPKDVAAEITGRSEYMQTRMSNAVAEVQQTLNELMLDPSTYDRARTWAAKHGHVLSAATQSIVDTVTWMAAYDDAVAQGRSEREAVRRADSVVRETQGSGAPEDLARFEAQTPFTRMFTMFSGYFNMQANLLGSEFTKTVRAMGLRKGAGRLLYVYTLGFMIPAVLSEAIMAAGRGRPLDEEDDGPTDDVLALFFGSQFSTLARMVPVVGPVVEASVRQFGGAHGDDRVSTSSAIQAVERAASAPKDVYHALQEKQLSNKEIRDILTALGLLTGLPFGAAARPVSYLHDVSTGRAEPANPLDFTRGLVSGQPGGMP